MASKRLGSSTLGYGQGTPFDKKPADVLVIDADTISREQLRAAIEADGYRVHVIANHAALARLNRKVPPRLVIANVEDGAGLLIAYGLADFYDSAPSLVLPSKEKDPSLFEGVTRFVPVGDQEALVAAVKDILGAPMDT